MSINLKLETDISCASSSSIIAIHGINTGDLNRVLDKETKPFLQKEHKSRLIDSTLKVGINRDSTKPGALNRGRVLTTG
jgi:20S proteasome alpha/beta subunit